MESTENPAELAELLAQSEPILINGEPVTVSAFAIDQLTAASKLAKSLFIDTSINFSQDDFILDLSDQHVDNMKGLVALSTGMDKAKLNMPLPDFMRLFTAMLYTNDDFFFLAINRATAKPSGQTSSSDSSETDTADQND